MHGGQWLAIVFIMSRNQKRRDKDKYEPVKEEEWIEMEDLRAPRNENLSRKFAEEEGKQYVPIKEKPQSNIKPFNENNTNNEPTSPQKKDSPKKITISFDAHRDVENKPAIKVKRPSIPMMQVTCNYCTVVQSLPGNAQLYICGSCQNMNECQPLYGVFVCDCCQTKVCYGFGTSRFIKCVRCSTISKVPTEPIKKYESGIVNQPSRPPQQWGQREREREQPPMRYQQFNGEQYVPRQAEADLLSQNFSQKRYDYP